MRVPVILSKEYSGLVLFNVISEVARELFHDVETKGRPHRAFSEGKSTETIIGNSFTANFTFDFVRQVPKFWSGNYKEIREGIKLLITLNMLYPAIQYACIEFEIFRRYQQTGNLTNYDLFDAHSEEFLVLFKTFLNKIFTKLADQK